MRDMSIKTVDTHPEHTVVGHFYRGWGSAGQATYLCDSYDPAIGFWMTNIADESDRRNVSERAIGRTFHEPMPWEWKKFGITEEVLIRYDVRAKHAEDWTNFCEDK